eukprot:688718-Amphidinium_carterae.2
MVSHETLTCDKGAGPSAGGNSEGVPYVDFALWVPHHVRMKKKLAFTGLIIGADGVLRRAEIEGDPRGFGAVSLARLDRYSDYVAHAACGAIP